MVKTKRTMTDERTTESIWVVCLDCHDTLQRYVLTLSLSPPQLQPRPSTNNLYASGWNPLPEARRLSQLVVDSFRKSSKDGVQGRIV